VERSIGKGWGQKSPRQFAPLGTRTEAGKTDRKLGKRATRARTQLHTNKRCRKGKCQYGTEENDLLHGVASVDQVRKLVELPSWKWLANRTTTSTHTSLNVGEKQEAWTGVHAGIVGTMRRARSTEGRAAVPKAAAKSTANWSAELSFARPFLSRFFCNSPKNSRTLRSCSFVLIIHDLITPSMFSDHFCAQLGCPC
jgi:hypothetical protein